MREAAVPPFFVYNAGISSCIPSTMNLHPSRAVKSPQQGIHPRLAATVDAHLGPAWQAPLHPPSVAAFDALREQIGDDTGRLVVDSGCGTGDSTRLIARAWPDSLVIGVDKSRARLAHTGAATFPHREGNAIWLRAELATFWRMVLRAGWQLRQHFLLYPNPWPKPRHLRRRWHAHPVFPDLMRLGGQLELRCNWEVYALEFATAANRVLGGNCRPQVLDDSVISSPFERKYRASGHILYTLSVCCGEGGVQGT